VFRCAFAACVLVGVWRCVLLGRHACLSRHTMHIGARAGMRVACPVPPHCCRRACPRPHAHHTHTHTHTHTLTHTHQHL
jgi:hypothetical protein